MFTIVHSFTCKYFGIRSKFVFIREKEREINSRMDRDIAEWLATIFGKAMIILIETTLLEVIKSNPFCLLKCFQVANLTGMSIDKITFQNPQAYWVSNNSVQFNVLTYTNIMHGKYGISLSNELPLCSNSS